MTARYTPEEIARMEQENRAAAVALQERTAQERAAREGRRHATHAITVALEEFPVVLPNGQVVARAVVRERLANPAYCQSILAQPNGKAWLADLRASVGDTAATARPAGQDSLVELPGGERVSAAQLAARLANPAYCVAIARLPNGHTVLAKLRASLTTAEGCGQ